MLKIILGAFSYRWSGQAGYGKMSRMSSVAWNEFLRAEGIAWTVALAASIVVKFVVQHFRSSLIFAACALERNNGLPCSLTPFSLSGVPVVCGREGIISHGTNS